MLIEGKAALGYAPMETLLFELKLAPGSSKKPPLILEFFRVNNEGASKISFDEDHHKAYLFQNDADQIYGLPKAF
jgi:hypothetical protein